MLIINKITRKKLIVFLFLSCFLLIVFFLIFPCKKAYYVTLPVSFNTANCPLVGVEIEGKTYHLKIDLGSKFQLSLLPEILDKLTKKPNGIAHWKNGKGDSFESSFFILPKICIEKLLSFSNITVKEENRTCITRNIIWDDVKDEHLIQKNKTIGAIGRPLLKKQNLLLDFPNSEIVACSSLKKLKKMHPSFKNYLKIPFIEGRTGIIINVKTDDGVQRLSLDTGSTKTLIRNSLEKNKKYIQEEHGYHLFTTSKFVIGEKDFGEKELLLLDITPELYELDGFLGMDFLKQHRVWIDFKNKFLYLEK